MRRVDNAVIVVASSDGGIYDGDLIGLYGRMAANGGEN
jgi:hypothetical protein